jgi:hypothetical protein
MKYLTVTGADDIPQLVTKNEGLTLHQGGTPIM